MKMVIFFNAAWLTIRRIPGNNQITRPLIIAEGLDTGNFTAPEDFGGETTLDDFNRSLANTGNLDNLIEIGTNDYDLIYIDWIRGMADMRDNSRVLEEVLEWVNAHKVIGVSGVLEPNVLLGQSMGGVIGRYTLARMENENKTHDVRLFIAHDSPMQGANTPLAFLHFANHMRQEYASTPLAWGIGEVLVPIGVGLQELGSAFLNAFGGNNSVPAYVTPAQLLSLQDQTASRQLNYWSAVSGPFGSQTQTRSYNQSWQQTLTAMGWPVLSRNVAISNGNECGVDNGFPPGAPLMSIDSRSPPGFWLDMLNIFLAPVAGVAIQDLGLIIVGALPGNSRWQTNFDFNSYGALGSQNQIYRGKIQFQKKLLWIGPTINYNITNKTYNAPQQALPFDTYSGGRFEFFNRDENGNPVFVFDDIPVLSDLIVVQNDFYGFIPVVSALDIKRNNGDVIPSDYLLKYAGGTIPNPALSTEFNNFIVDFLPNAFVNNEHISFQVRNGNWLANELNEMPILIEDCKFICGDSQIIGPLVLCSSATYSVSVPAGTTVNWSISNTSAASITSQSGGNVTISATTGYKGDFVLTSNITSVCGNLPLTKPIRVGRPDAPSSISGPSTVNTGAIVNYVAGSSNGATSYEWRLPYPFTIRTPLDYMSQDWQLQGPGDTGNARAVTGYTKKSGYVQVMGKNACGTGGAKLLYVQHATSGGGGGGIPRIDPNDDVVEVTLYPNPTQGKVTVALTNLEDYSGEPPTLIYGIQVLDQNLYERKFYNFNDQSRSQELNVSYLNTGLNYIIVYTDTGTFTKKLIVY